MQVTVSRSDGRTVTIEVGGMRIVIDPRLNVVAADGSHARDACMATGEADGHVNVVLVTGGGPIPSLDATDDPLLTRVPHIVASPAGAQHLGGRAHGLAPWASITIMTPGYDRMRIVATPGTQGTADADHDAIGGFVLLPDDPARRAIYVAGGSRWRPGLAEVAHRYPCGVALLGVEVATARTVADDVLAAARAFGRATIVPLLDGRAPHAGSALADIERAFATAGLSGRLAPLAPGDQRSFTLDAAPTAAAAEPALA